LLGAAVFVAVGVLQAPLLWVLAVAVPLAIALEWRAPR
jgi:chromate transporter